MRRRSTCSTPSAGRAALPLALGGTALVRLDRETLRYGGAMPVLHDVTLAVAPGERIALLGRSGAGKSTLLAALRRRLHGGDDADRGKVSGKGWGKDAGGGRVRAALVPQDGLLVPALSAFHNIYMGRLDRYSALRNLATLVRPFRADCAAVAAIARSLDIEPLLDRPVDELSGGQRQRVAAGRALFAGGDLLLADEPVSALDEAQAPRVLSALLGSFTSAVVALHDVSLARAHCTRLIGLRAQRVAFDAPAADATEEAVADLYAA